MISQFFEEQLLAHGDLDPQTTAAPHAINEPNRRWLGNIPVAHIVKLRLNKENEEFRTRLQRNVSELHEASLEDLKRVVPSVSREIASLFIQHDTEIHAIQEAYKSKYKDLAVEEYVTPAASVLPTLAPVVRPNDPSASPERKVRDEPARSLLGLLAVPEKS